MNPLTTPIILILIIVMPGNQPDVNKFLSMPTVEECTAQVLDWEKYGLMSGVAIKGGVAVRGACQVKINGFFGS